MKRSTIALILIILSALQISAYKKESIDINVNGQKRNMVVFTPNSLPAKSPLFIVTHGMDQSPEYQYDSDKMYEMIDTAKFVITYLRSDGNTWDTGSTKDQNFVIKTIDEMASRYNIDTDRVYWSDSPWVRCSSTIVSVTCRTRLLPLHQPVASSSQSRPGTTARNPSTCWSA